MPAPPVDIRIVVRQIAAAETITLRHEVLWPSKSRTDVVLAEDMIAGTVHLGAFLVGAEGGEAGGEPVSVLTLVPTRFPSSSPSLAKLPALQFRKFATLPAVQSQGIGSQLLSEVWDRAQAQGAQVVWCNGRREQEGWYTRRGMRREGDPFVKDGRNYVLMIKRFD